MKIQGMFVYVKQVLLIENDEGEVRGETAYIEGAKVVTVIITPGQFICLN